MLNVNLRGVRSNFGTLTSFLHQLNTNIDVLVVTEARLDKQSESLYNISGYNKLHLHRNDKGGGILAYIKSSLHFEKIEKFTGIFESHEALCFSITPPKSPPITIFAVYRPPDHDLGKFLNYFENLHHRSYRRKIILVGDINACISRDANNRKFVELKSFLACHNFRQLISFPTFYSHQSNPSTLDHTWTNLDVKTRSYVFKSPLSDHNPTITFFDINRGKDKLNVWFRDFSLKNILKFVRSLEIEIPKLTENLNNEKSLEGKFVIITKWLEDICNKYFPTKMKIISRKRFSKPWISTEISKLIDKKHRLHGLLLSNRITRDYYSSYCNSLKHLLEVAENSFHKSKLEATKFNPKKKWKYINSFLKPHCDSHIDYMDINGKTSSDSPLISNSFNKFYKNVPYELKGKLKKSTKNYNSDIESTNCSIFFNPTSPSEIEGVIKNLKKSSNLAGIPTKFLSLASDKISGILSQLFNQCLEESYYPQLFRKSIVRPIFKSGKRTDIGNYRPISILPILGKIFEKIIFKRLYNFVTHKGIISENQFGFIKKKSTSQANLKVSSAGLKAIQDQSYTLAVFLDFSKAFDCVDHNLLLGKLQKCGIRGLTHDLISSYLSDRYQRVSISSSSSQDKNPMSNTFLSDEEKISIGVPQGSCNGPLFYILYTNDLNDVLKKVNPNVDITMFADDTCLTLHGCDLPNLVHQMNDLLKVLYDWCCFNGLTLNAVKSKAVIFSNKNYPNPPQLFINGEIIEYANEIVYLGLVLDSKLKYGKHIENVCNKLSQLSGISYKVGPKFDLNSAKLFYFSFVYSLISYGVVVWGGVLIHQSCTEINRLWQKILHNLFSRHFPQLALHDICKKLKILNLTDIYKFNALNLYVQSVHDNSMDFIKPELNQRCRALRNKDPLHVIFPKSHALKISLKRNIAIIWNFLPNDIKAISDPRMFKSRYKAYLLANTGV